MHRELKEEVAEEEEEGKGRLRDGKQGEKKGEGQSDIPKKTAVVLVGNLMRYREGG